MQHSTAHLFRSRASHTKPYKMCADMVTNPRIPYSGYIPGGLFPTKTIHVRGLVPHGSPRFSVNLQSGVGTNVSDIAFQFNPRFAGGQYFAVCNTKTGQRWGEEERHHYNFPFAHGKNFHIIIRCESNEFMVAVNGRHFIEYRHRVPNLQLINAVSVNGTVTVYSIRFEAASATAYQPQPTFPAQPAFPAQPTYPITAGIKVVSDPSLPYLDTIPGGMKEGKIIVIEVGVNPFGKGFHVNFQCGMSTNPRSDVAMQVNPRFKEKLVNVNTLRSTKWDGNEEKHRGYFRFRPFGSYEMKFLCERHQFKVKLNGSYLLAFKHRLPFQNISALGVDGDCTVSEIIFY